MQAENRQANNFDFLRFLLAFVVFLCHSAELSQKTELSIFTHFLSSNAAVNGFFIISGYLVYESYLRSKSLKSYFIKRAKRILPAYIVCVLVCTFLVAFFLKVDFSWSKISQYFLPNILFLNFLQPQVEGVFANNPLPIINGALWTIKVELLFYFSIPIIVITSKYLNRKWLIFAVIYTLSMVLFWYLNYQFEQTEKEIFLSLSHQFPAQAAFFVSGIAMNEWVKQRHWKFTYWQFLLGIVLYLGSREYALFYLEPIFLSISVLSFTYLFPLFNNFGKYGDFSYGLYLFHFPIIQSVIHFGGYQNVFIGFATSLVLVLLTSVLSWNLVEKPFLKSNLKA